MSSSRQAITVFSDHILVERPPDYELSAGEQLDALPELSAACQKSGCNKVLIVGQGTRVSLSAFDIVDLGKEIARLNIRLAIAESHDASPDAVSLLTVIASNRGSEIRFFDCVSDAKAWLGIE